MAFVDQVFISIHAAYIQWQMGMLDDRLWKTFNQAMIDQLLQPGQREWWELRRHWFEEDFQEYVDNAVASGEAKPMHPKAVST